MDPRSLEDMASHTMEIDSVDDNTAVQRTSTSSTSLAVPRVSLDSITPDQQLQSFLDCCDWTRVCLGNGNSAHKCSRCNAKVHRLCQAAGERMYGWNARGELILYCPICHPDNVAAQEAKQTGLDPEVGNVIVHKKKDNKMSTKKRNRLSDDAKIDSVFTSQDRMKDVSILLKGLLETRRSVAKQQTDTNEMMMMIDDATADADDERCQLDSLTIQVLTQAIKCIDEEDESIRSVLANTASKKQANTAHRKATEDERRATIFSWTLTRILHKDAFLSHSWAVHSTFSSEV